MTLGPAFADVLGAARTGADWAWTQLYRDLVPAVLGYLRAHNAPDAEDLTSEVFVAIVRNLGTFEGTEEQFRSWVFVIVHRRMQDARRSMARHPVDPHPTERLERRCDVDVEGEALDAMSTARVRRTFGLLSEDQRDVLTLRIIAELSLDETARVLGKSTGAVKSLQHRGLQNVVKILSDQSVPH